MPSPRMFNTVARMFKQGGLGKALMSHLGRGMQRTGGFIKNKFTGAHQVVKNVTFTKTTQMIGDKTIRAEKWGAKKLMGGGGAVTRGAMRHRGMMIGAGAVLGAGIGVSRAVFDQYRMAEAPMRAGMPVVPQGMGHSNFGIKPRGGPLPAGHLSTQGLTLALHRNR